MAEEKTEAPTAKRRRESRKEGQVARTPELGQWATLLAFGLLVNAVGRREIDSIRKLMVEALGLIDDPEPTKALDLLATAFQHAMFAVVVIGSAVMFVGVLSTVAQGGFFVATKAAKPSFKKLNPVSGLKRMFGPHAWWELGKTLVKSCVLGFIAYRAIGSVVPLIGGLVPPTATMSIANGAITHLFRTMAIAGLVMAGADYLFQRRKIGKQVRMTKEEVKQEAKQQEGDPHVKSAIRSRQLAAARGRMMADVATADVILVNPTHVAVALKYDPARGAPKVVGKGAGAVAAKIREKAAESDIPLVRDVPLARALYSSCQLGQEIPQELFAAVAQVLAFVISRRTQGHKGGAHDTPRFGVELPEVSRVRRRPGAALDATAT